MGGPVVLLHGLLVNGLLWRKVLPQREPDFRVIGAAGVGSRGSLFKFEYAQRLAGDIPGARLESIVDAYAFVPEDQPERTAKLIGAFARERRATAPSA